MKISYGWLPVIILLPQCDKETTIHDIEFIQECILELLERLFVIRQVKLSDLQVNPSCEIRIEASFMEFLSLLIWIPIVSFKSYSEGYFDWFILLEIAVNEIFDILKGSTIFLSHYLLQESIRNCLCIIDLLEIVVHLGLEVILIIMMRDFFSMFWNMVKGGVIMWQMTDKRII